MKRMRGLCPVCGKWFAVTFDGTTWSLYRHGLPECVASHREPAEVMRPKGAR